MVRKSGRQSCLFYNTGTYATVREERLSCPRGSWRTDGRSPAERGVYEKARPPGCASGSCSIYYEAGTRRSSCARPVCDGVPSCTSVCRCAYTTAAAAASRACSLHEHYLSPPPPISQDRLSKRNTGNGVDRQAHADALWGPRDVHVRRGAAERHHDAQADRRVN